MERYREIGPFHFMPLISFYTSLKISNQWTGFFTIETSVMKELKAWCYLGWGGEGKGGGSVSILDDNILKRIESVFTVIM